MRWICFPWVCKTFLPAYSNAKIIKIERVLPELWCQMYCHVFFSGHSVDVCNFTCCGTLNRPFLLLLIWLLSLTLHRSSVFLRLFYLQAATNFIQMVVVLVAVQIESSQTSTFAREFAHQWKRLGYPEIAGPFQDPETVRGKSQDCPDHEIACNNTINHMCWWLSSCYQLSKRWGNNDDSGTSCW